MSELVTRTPEGLLNVETGEILPATVDNVAVVIQAWANLSGEYRRDLDDFVEMCVPCHKHFDIARRKAA